MRYQINLLCNYDYLYLKIKPQITFATEKAASNFLNGSSSVELQEKGLLVRLNNYEEFLGEEQYSFEVITKDNKPQLDIKTLSPEDLATLICSQDYILEKPGVTYNEVPWSTKEVYSKLRLLYPEREQYFFDCIAYKITPTTA